MSTIDSTESAGRWPFVRDPNRVSRAALILGVLSLALVLAACGSGAADTSAPTVPSIDEPDRVEASAGTSPEEVDPEEAMREYDECLAEHGVDLPEPDEDGVVIFGEVAGDDGPSGFAEFDAAMETCGTILDEAFGEFELDPEQAAEFADQELEFARCMRENGVADWPDPSGDPGAVMTMEFEGEPNQDDLNAALSACTEQVYDAPGGAASGFSVVVP